MIGRSPVLFITVIASIVLLSCEGEPGRGAKQEPEGISLLGEPLLALPEGPEIEDPQRALAEARADLRADPGDPDKIIWVGRRLGYLWRMREAIAVYTAGIESHPDHAPLYRHRGHRYISIRRFDDAIADLEKAAALIGGKPDEVEPDGMPNAMNIPLTTTGFNIWYHLGLARYLKGDLEGTVEAYRKTLEYTRGYDDNLVAVSDWLYMALRRLGRDEEAAAVLEPITTDMDIIENDAYHRRLLMYKGLISPDELLVRKDPDTLDLSTLGYGLGNWYGYNGDTDKARSVFRQVVSQGRWPAFGTLAAEVELARSLDNES